MCLRQPVALRLVQRADALRHRHLRVRPVDQQQIDRRQVEQLQAVVERAGEIVGLEIVVAHLGGEEDLLALHAGGRDRLARPRARCRRTPRCRCGDSRCGSPTRSPARPASSFSRIEPKPTIGMRAPCASTNCMEFLLEHAGWSSCRKQDVQRRAEPTTAGNRPAWRLPGRRCERRRYKPPTVASSSASPCGLVEQTRGGHRHRHRAVVGDQRASADDRRLDRHRLHVADGQLTGDRRSARSPGRRRPPTPHRDRQRRFRRAPLPAAQLYWPGMMIGEITPSAVLKHRTCRPAGCPGPQPKHCESGYPTGRWEAAPPARQRRRETVREGATSTVRPRRAQISRLS